MTELDTNLTAIFGKSVSYILRACTFMGVDPSQFKFSVLEDGEDAGRTVMTFALDNIVVYGVTDGPDLIVWSGYIQTYDYSQNPPKELDRIEIDACSDIRDFISTAVVQRAHHMITGLWDNLGDDIEPMQIELTQPETTAGE